MYILQRSRSIRIVEERDAREGEVAAPPRELLEGEAASARPGRQAQLDDQLVLCEQRGERAGKEIRCARGSRTARAGDGDLGVAGHGDARQLGRGIGVREAAADGAAVADLVMRDVRHGFEEKRMRFAQSRVILDVAPAHARAELHAVLADRDATEAADFAQVDEDRRRGEAKGHGGNEALATGEGFRTGMRGEQLHCLVDARRRGVLELRQFHCSGLSRAVFTTLAQRSMSLR